MSVIRTLHYRHLGFYNTSKLSETSPKFYDRESNHFHSLNPSFKRRQNILTMINIAFASDRKKIKYMMLKLLIITVSFVGL